MTKYGWIVFLDDPFSKKVVKTLKTNDMLAIWFKLVCFATVNEDKERCFSFVKELPFTDRQLADQLNVSLQKTRNALKSFIEIGLIEVTRDPLQLNIWQLYEGLPKEKRGRKRELRDPSEYRKRKYGDYRNVLLTDNEYEKLKEEFPKDYERRIQDLSYYIETKGVVYKNHLATIESWARKEYKQNTVAQELNTLYEMAGNWAESKMAGKENIVNE